MPVTSLFGLKLEGRNTSEIFVAIGGRIDIGVASPVETSELAINAAAELLGSTLIRFPSNVVLN